MCSCALSDMYAMLHAYSPCFLSHSCSANVIAVGFKAAAVLSRRGGTGSQHAEQAHSQPPFKSRSMGHSLLNSITFAIPSPNPSGSPTASAMILSELSGLEVVSKQSLGAALRKNRAAVRRCASVLAFRYMHGLPWGEGSVGI